jgi:hypothetical protein
MESIMLGDDIEIFFEPEIGEVTFCAQRIGGKKVLLSFNKDDLEKLIPWLQSKQVEMS